MLHPSALLDFRKSVDGTNHLAQGDLGVLVEVTVVGHVALQVNPDRCPFGAGAGEANHNATSILQKNP